MRSVRVLFVDPDHGPRSQMAAALLARAAGPGIVVSSAGTVPNGDLSGVKEALRQPGIAEFVPARTDLTSIERPPELLISVCEEGCAACPFYPGSGEVRRWPFPDPAATNGRQRDELLRCIRHDLQPLIAGLATELSEAEP